MKIRTLVAIFIIGLVAILVGCRTSPVMNIEGSGINTNIKSVSDVKVAILDAGDALGWKMKPVEDGHIIGTFRLKKHTARVDIKYNKINYSITYRGSINLRYRPEGSRNYSGPVIHNRYNQWIQDLDQGIQKYLDTL